MRNRKATLDALARDGSAEGRGRLLVDLGDLVLTDPPAGADERALFFDIARRILPDTATPYRRRFSETAADRDCVPLDVLMVLATDAIEIAAPVLTRSSGFGEAELIVLATHQSDAHRLAIAGRPAVAGTVTEVLVRHGSLPVLRRLGTNEGAVFTAAAIEDVRRRAEGDEELFAVFVARADLADLLAGSLRETMSRLAAAPPKRARTAAPARPIETRPENAGVARLLADLRTGRRRLGEIVVELADADRHADLARFLGDVSSIDESQILRVLVRSDSNGIAMVARGLEIADDAWARIVELRRRKLKFSASQCKWEREHYGRLDVLEAKATLSNFADRRRG